MEEKIKALKSLESKGLKFKGWHIPKEGSAKIIITANCVPNISKELDILFGDNTKKICVTHNPTIDVIKVKYVGKK